MLFFTGQLRGVTRYFIGALRQVDEGFRLTPQEEGLSRVILSFSFTLAFR